MSKKFRNESERLRYEHIQELKRQKSSAYKVSLGDNTDCYLQVLNRGEQMYFQLGEKALICEISALHGIIYSDSVKKWDDNSKVSDNERLIFEKAVRIYWEDKNRVRVRFASKDGTAYE
jgi:hypothetical protein